MDELKLDDVDLPQVTDKPHESPEVQTELDIRNRVRARMIDNINELLARESEQTYEDCDSLNEISIKFQEELVERLRPLVPPKPLTISVVWEYVCSWFPTRN